MLCFLSWMGLVEFQEQFHLFRLEFLCNDSFFLVQDIYQRCVFNAIGIGRVEAARCDGADVDEAFVNGLKVIIHVNGKDFDIVATLHQSLQILGFGLTDFAIVIVKEKD